MLAMFTTLRKKLDTARALYRLGATRRDRRRLFGLVFWPFVEKKLRRAGVRWQPDFTITIRFAALTQTLFLQGLHDEITLLHEIFIEECYRLDAVREAAVIIDAGANIGLSPLYFAARYPRATVHAIEPDPRNFERLQKNIAGLARIKPHAIAFGAANGERELFVQADKIISSSLTSRGGTERPVRVTVRTLDDFARSEGIRSVDILKFDVEGAEFDMLRDCRLLEHTHAVVGEVHEDLMGKPAAELYGLFPKELQVQRRERQKDHREVFYALRATNGPAA